MRASVLIDAVLHECEAESLAILSLLLSQDGVNVNQPQVPDGFTALMYAARFAPATVTALLIKSGANVNATDNAGETALMHACRNTAHGAENVQCLMAAGANTSIRRVQGEKALHFAYAVSPELMRLVGGPKDAFQNTLPNNACSDTLACMSYAAVRFGLKMDPLWSSKHVNRQRPAAVVWSGLRSGVRPDYDALFTSLIAVPCADPQTWHWIGYEMQSRQEGAAYETLLHVACRSPVSAMAVPVLLRLCLNPYLRDNKGCLPLDVCVAKETRSLLRGYMRWRPTIQHTRWFGPFFEKRARAFLLVCTRLETRLVPPRDVRYMIVAHLARHEFTQVNPFAFP